MKIFTVILALLLVGLQWPLWIGRGSVSAVNKMERDLAERRAEVSQLQTRNTALGSEIRDLKDIKIGMSAVEDHARSELGMIKSSEVFFQLVTESSTIARMPAAVENNSKRATQ